MKMPLDGARLKVVRAQEHLDSLNREIGEYLDANPYHFPIEKNGDLVAVSDASSSREPPLHLSCVIGDCVTNLRASLDYIAWQIVQNSGVTLSLGQARGVTFPLSNDPTTYPKTDAKLKNFGVPAAALGIIESLQPYHARNKELRTLEMLVNTDKHRLPLLTRAELDASKIVVTVSHPTTDSTTIRLPNGESYTFGTKNSPSLSSVSFGNPEALKAGIPGPFVQKTDNVQVDGQIAAFIAFRDPGMPIGPIQTTLADIIKTVTDIIPSFEPFV